MENPRSKTQLQAPRTRSIAEEDQTDSTLSWKKTPIINYRRLFYSQ
jgi:hypothetical protein